jgi:sulfite reductase beta subunit-like hemoprotein
MPMLETILRKYKAERQSGEDFGGFCQRVGLDSLRAAAEM